MVTTTQRMTQSLRPSLLEEYLMQLRTRCLDVAKAASEHKLEGVGSEQEREVYGRLQHIFSELTILYPLDEAISAAMSTVGAELQAVVQGQKSKDVLAKLDMCYTMVEGGGTFEETVKEYVALHGIMAGLTGAVQADRDQQADLQNCCMAAWKFVAETWLLPEPQISAEEAEKICEMCAKIIEHVNIDMDHLKPTQAWVSAVVSLQSKCVELGVADGMNKASWLESEEAPAGLKALNRALVKVGGVRMELPSDATELMRTLHQQCKSFHDATVKVVSALSGALEQTSGKLFSKCLADLSKIKGGRENGSQWAGTLPPKASWKIMQERYLSGSLFDVDPSKLVDAIDALEKALHTPSMGGGVCKTLLNLWKSSGQR